MLIQTSGPRRDGEGMVKFMRREQLIGTLKRALVFAVHRLAATCGIAHKLPESDTAPQYAHSQLPTTHDTTSLTHDSTGDRLRAHPVTSQFA